MVGDEYNKRNTVKNVTEYMYTYGRKELIQEFYSSLGSIRRLLPNLNSASHFFIKLLHFTI